MFAVAVNGNAPLSIVIFEQQRIVHVDPGAPFIWASLATHIYPIASGLNVGNRVARQALADDP